MDRKEINRKVSNIRRAVAMRMDDEWVTIKGTHVLIDENGTAKSGGGLIGKSFSKAKSTSSAKGTGEKGAKGAKENRGGGGKKAAGKQSAAKQVGGLAKKLDHTMDVEALNDYISALIEQDDPDIEYPEDPTDYKNEKTVKCKTPEDKKKLIGKWLDAAISNTERSVRGLKEGGAADSHWEVQWKKECVSYYKGLKKTLGAKGK